MSTAAWYTVVVGALWPVGFFALQRMGWPADLRKRLLATSGLAIAWPLAVPTLSFGSVAIVHLRRVQKAPAKEQGVVASPAAAS
jgi:hypothetical protein